MIGHKVGEKITVLLPAGEGYNAPDTEVTVSASAATTIGSTEVLTAAQFRTIYGYDLKGYEEIEKSAYGWPASASYNSSSNTITMQYRPVAGTSYTMVDNDFGTVALNVSSVSGTISYTYSVSGFTVISTEGINKEIQMIMLDFGTEKVYIESVTDTDNNGVADSFTYKTVSERYNQALYFEIEIVTIG